MSALLAVFYYGLLPVLSIMVTLFWFKKASSRRHKQVVFVVCSIWSVWLIWNLVGVEKILMDRKVDRLCAKDGGIKVYEKVVLSATKFEKYRNVDLPSMKKVTTEDEYYYIRETTYLKRGNPSMWKSEYKIYRKNDSKLLGESIRYSRRGGDLPGPWHASSHGCPEISKEVKGIEQMIFVREGQ